MRSYLTSFLLYGRAPLQLYFNIYVTPFQVILKIIFEILTKTALCDRINENNFHKEVPNGNRYTQDTLFA